MFFSKKTVKFSIIKGICLLMTMFSSFSIFSAEWTYDEEKQLLTDGTWGFDAKISETNHNELYIIAHAIEPYTNHSLSCQLDLGGANHITNTSGRTFSLTKIESSDTNGFFNASSLVNSIILPSSLKSLPSYFINGCTNIDEIIIHDGGGEYVIPQYFIYNSSLKSIKINSEKIKEFNDYAVVNNKQITNLISDIVSPSIKKLGNYSFMNSSFSGELIATNISDTTLYSTFEGTSITSYVITAKSPGVERIKRLFYGAKNFVTLKLNAPKLKYAESYAFSTGSSFYSIIYSSDFIISDFYMSDHAFYYVTFLDDITLNILSTNIANSAFSRARVIKDDSDNQSYGSLSINCPYVRSIDYAAFDGVDCTSLSITSTNIETIAEQGLSRIGNNALTKINIDFSNVKKVGKRALYGSGSDMSLKSTFNYADLNNLEEADMGAFGLIGFKYIKIGNNLKKIGAIAFYLPDVFKNLSEGLNKIEFSKNTKIDDIEYVTNSIQYNNLTSIVFRCNAPTNCFDEVGKTNTITKGKLFVDMVLGKDPISDLPIRRIIYCDKDKGWSNYARPYDANIDGTNVPEKCFGVYETSNTNNLMKAYMCEIPVNFQLIFK